MIRIIKAEFIKLKRLHILLIGMIGMTFPSILSIFTQKVTIPEKQIGNFDFTTLFNHTVWNSTTIFMPVIFTLIGGSLINREYKDDTLKNLFTIPISFPRLIYGKLIAMGIISILLGYYSYFITLIVGFITGLTVPDFTALLKGFEQTTVISLCTFISVLPIIVFTSRKQDTFMGGVIVSFLFGYFSMFIKNATLRSIYPILSGLTIIRFDTNQYMNTSGTGSFAISLITMAILLLLTNLLIIMSYSGNAHT